MTTIALIEHFHADSKRVESVSTDPWPSDKYRRKIALLLSISVQWRSNLKTQRAERCAAGDYRRMDCGHTTAIAGIK
jgi:hypothetical protein